LHDAQGFFALAGEPDDVIQPRPRRFGGRVLVLADASNSSATFQFGQTVKDHRLGTIVGQTSGGNRRGINGGAFFFLRLPGCGLEVDLPLIGTFPRTPQPDAGVAPDIAVRPTARAVADGTDLEMRAALAALA
jgi:C-terminal processing protease CtpA/Prc